MNGRFFFAICIFIFSVFSEFHGWSENAGVENEGGQKSGVESTGVGNAGGECRGGNQRRTYYGKPNKMGVKA